MEPQPQPKLSSVSWEITSVLLQEAAIALVENDSAFSALLIECVTGGPRPSELVLDNVTLVRCRKQTWSALKFPRVSIRPNPYGIWVAEVIQTGQIFREPSDVPYQVISISKDDYAQLSEYVKKNYLLAVFEYSQRIFGTLPGFAYRGDGLMVPNEYAAAGHQISNREYVTGK